MRFHKNIVQAAEQNTYFRQELNTGEHSQVVVMSIPAREDIGEEVHDVDQILVFVRGKDEVVLNGESAPVEVGDLVFVPAGTRHNFINTGKEDWKLYTVYSPAEHKPGTVHKTKAEAEAAEYH